MIEKNLPVTLAKLVVVIATVSFRGSGTDDDPVRSLDQYWSTDGRLLAEHDTLFDDGELPVKNPSQGVAP